MSVWTWWAWWGRSTSNPLKHQGFILTIASFSSCKKHFCKNWCQSLFLRFSALLLPSEPSSKLIMKNDLTLNELKHTKDKNGSKRPIFSGKVFVKKFWASKIHIRGCKWVKYRCKFFLFFVIVFLRPLFKWLNLRLSHKRGHLDIFKTNKRP